MKSIAITRKYVHITHYSESGRPQVTKTFRNDRISQYSRNRVYRIAKNNATRATINSHGITQYYID